LELFVLPGSSIIWKRKRQFVDVKKSFMGNPYILFRIKNVFYVNIKFFAKNIMISFLYNAIS